MPSLAGSADRNMRRELLIKGAQSVFPHSLGNLVHPPLKPCKEDFELRALYIPGKCSAP